MIGIDITDISRFENKSDNYAKRFLSTQEFEDFKKTSKKAFFLALHWAIKEAIYKCDNYYVNFSKINISKSKEGRMIFKDFLISTSSEKNTLVAFVQKKCNKCDL